VTSDTSSRRELLKPSVPSIPSIGQHWVSSSRMGTLAKVGSRFQLAQRIVHEGRLGEVVVDIYREALPYVNNVVYPGKPTLSRYEDGLKHHRRIARLRIDELTAQLDGACHTSPSTGHFWAWRGRSLLLMGGGITGSADEVFRFGAKITAVHQTSANTLLVCLPGRVEMSPDGGLTFSEVLRLSHPWSIVMTKTLAEDDGGRLVIGEYGNVRDDGGRWQSTAWIHSSLDGGGSWTSTDFLIRAGVDKHVHVVVVCGKPRRLHLTTGDSRKWHLALRGAAQSVGSERSWARLSRGPWHLSGYASVAVTGAATYWGTDYRMGTNFVVVDHHNGGSTRWMLGGPLRGNPVTNMGAVGSGKSQYVLAASREMCARRGRASGLLAFDETNRKWHTLLIDASGERKGAAFAVAQCQADRGSSSWGHLRLRTKSYALMPEAGADG
jgi:hypothetical protein